MQRLLLSVGAVLVVSTVSAQPLETHNLSPLSVNSEILPKNSLDQRLDLYTQQENLNKSLKDIPGVSMRSIGADNGEPVLRGLGWERVETQYNGLCLYGACPSRMDPPINLFNAASLDAIRVELGPGSVIYGPLSTGGRIQLDSELDLAPEGEHLYGGSILGGYGSNGKNRNGNLQVGGATDKHAWQIDLGASASEDYVAGNDKKVPANGNSQDANAIWKGKLADEVILSLNTRWIYDWDIDYLALPMDTRHSKTNLYNGELQWLPETGSLRELSFHAGAGLVEHLMDNQDKPNRQMMSASTPSTADSYESGILSRWQLWQGEFRTGIDASLLERDALRTRTMNATGMSFQDPIWPDLSQEQAGIFSEWQGNLSHTYRLRAGARIDQVNSEAGKADAMIIPGPGIGKTTVADAWQSVGGSTSANPDQDDTLFSGNLLLTRTLSEDWLVHLGLGRTEAAPNLTQRYLSFGPIPGGYGIGTPSLDLETKYEIDLRTEGQLGPHQVGIALFAARIDDYLLPTTIAMFDVNADGQVDRIKGTVNQDAEMYGFEAAARLSLSPQFYMPLSISYVRGETTDGQNLPEIPPLEILGSLKWESPQKRQPYADFGFRYNAKQDKIDPNFGENETPSYIVWHIRAGLEVIDGWILEAGIENLFNKTYTDHLTREALMPAGDLAAGDEVPAPGRSFTLSTRYNW